MKKFFGLAVAFTFIFATSVFAQESKPVIGLIPTTTNLRQTTATGYWGDIYQPEQRDEETGKVIRPRRLAYPATSPLTIDSIFPKLTAAFSQEIVSSGRFQVLADKRTGVDYVFESELTEFSANRQGSLDSGTGVITYKMSVSVTLTDAKTGQVVLSQQFSEPRELSKSGGKVFSTTKYTSSNPNDMPKNMAENVISTIVNKLYPPMVLNVSGGVVQLPATGLSVGSVVEIFTQGEEIIDPYTGDSLGFEETLVAEVCVYEITGKIAKAKPDPKGAYVDAQIQRGMAIRNNMKVNKKALNNINKELKGK